MKIRIKFPKQGAMKFIGHLDTMRYFQKAMRRADVDIRYSEGFPPHVNRQIAQIPPFFLAIVPKRKKSPKGRGELLPSNPAGLPPPSVREATLSVIAARCQLPREGELICCKPSDV